jgi:outer membrane protein assembly factor BamB
MKLDAKTGTALWKSVNHGQQTFLAGKYVYETSSFVGGLAIGDALRDALGQASHAPNYFHIYRLDAKNGDLIWDYGKNEDGTPNQIDFQNNKILLNYGKEIRVMKFMQIF